MIASEIMLPPHAPEIYLDRATLWNAVENCEKHPKAQLAYSFDIAMQNELTLEENMELARKFVQEQFVTKGMIADLAFHSPEKEDGGIPNPHFHVMTTMRPLNPDGTWGQKQRREYLLDEDGNRIRDKNGDYMFNAVHTTDWHEPETLEHWREQWAAAVNTKFEEKGLDVRIDHRSYVRQGLDLIPTVHEGANVRQMEAKGIRIDKGGKGFQALITNRKYGHGEIVDRQREGKDKATDHTRTDFREDHLPQGLKRSRPQIQRRLVDILVHLFQAGHDA